MLKDPCASQKQTEVLITAALWMPLPMSHNPKLARSVHVQDKDLSSSFCFSSSSYLEKCSLHSLGTLKSENSGTGHQTEYFLWQSS